MKRPGVLSVAGKIFSAFWNKECRKITEKKYGCTALLLENLSRAGQ
jgi:hypothetical protein